MTAQTLTLPADARLEAPRAAEAARLTRRGAVWSALTVVTRQGVGLATTVALARLLSPDDYGLLGMAALLTGFLQAFADMGLSWAAVRHEGLTRQQASNLFWLNSVAGLALWGASALAGPAIAAFFGRRELAPIAAVAGAAFALNGLSAQAVALLTRRMRAGRLFAVELTSLIAGALTAVELACAGLGYWALVGQVVAVPAGRLVAAFAAGGPLPGAPRAGAGTLALVRFGGLLMASTFLNYLARNLDNLLIGKLWGAPVLGFYSRAYFLMSVPLLLGAYSLSGVMVPALSAQRGDRARLGRAYREAVRLSALIGLPAGGFLFVAAPELVRLVYGPRWAPVANLARWLALAGMMQTVSATSGWLYIALGKGRAMFMVSAVATACTSVAFVLGNRSGPGGVAAAYVLVNLLLLGPTLAAAHWIAGLSVRATLQTLRPVLLATLAAVAAGCAAGAAGARYSLSWECVLALKATAGALAFVLAVPLPFWGDVFGDPSQPRGAKNQG